MNAFAIIFAVLVPFGVLAGLATALALGTASMNGRPVNVSAADWREYLKANRNA